MPENDKGIDIIISYGYNKLICVQCKYRKNNDEIIPFNKLSTFLALALKNDIFEKGIIFTNTLNSCKDIQTYNKITTIMYNDFISCDNYIKNLRNYISKYIDNNNNDDRCKLL